MGPAAPGPPRRPAGAALGAGRDRHPPSACSGGRPAVRLEPSGPAAATGGVGGAALLVGTRMALWLGVQLGLAGLLLVAGRAATGGRP